MVLLNIRNDRAVEKGVENARNCGKLSGSGFGLMERALLS
jgi:hypothetical protein